METRKHVYTFENFNSLMLLYVSALSPDGQRLVHTHYDEDAKVSYVTMWNCKTGEIHKRLKNERDVCCMAMSDDAAQVVLGKSNGELRIWRPGKTQQSLQRVHAYKHLRFDPSSKIWITDDDTKAVVFAGSVSMWDLKKACILAVFTPDTPIECIHIAYQGHVIQLGMRHTSELVSLRPKAVAMVTDAPHHTTLEEPAFEEEKEEGKKSDDDDVEDDD